MSNSQRQAVITLIEKNGKDRTLIENWRPRHSLVNETRIKGVLPSIIHHNQY